MMTRPEKIYIYNGEPVRPCRGCQTPIWFKQYVKKDGTPGGMPVNRETGKVHWGECPAAAQFRKGLGKPDDRRTV